MLDSWRLFVQNLRVNIRDVEKNLIFVVINIQQDGNDEFGFNAGEYIQGVDDFG